MPIAVAQSEIDRFKAAVSASAFGSQAKLAAEMGLSPDKITDFIRGRVAPKTAKRLNSMLSERLGVTIEFTPIVQARWCKDGVPTFRPEHRHVFNKMVREAGFPGVKQLAEAVGLKSTNFWSMFVNAISSELYHRLQAAVLTATGIDLTELATTASAAEIAPGPIDDLHKAGWITAAEHAAGHRLATAADRADYPGREPLPCFVRSWSQDLQAMWRALMVADAETDRCRPRLPTASLVAWTVCIFREPLDLRDPCGRDALTALRIALQHMENPS